MIKTIVLIRHAKSSWEQIGQRDYDRALNERGKKDAPIMGQRIMASGIVPDLIVSSTAVRTMATAQLLAKSMNYKLENILGEERLYHAPPEVFCQIIDELPAGSHSVFMVAHNPGITEMANSFTSKFHIDNMPTCAVVAAIAQCHDWKDFNKAEKQISFYDYPKNLRP